MSHTIDLSAVKANIEHFLKIQGLSKKRLDARLYERRGRGQTLVKDIFSGKSLNPTLETITEIADALGVGIEQITGDGDLPVVGFVGAGGEIEYHDAYAKGFGMYDVAGLPGLNKDFIGLEVRGDSMLPLFRNGYVVFIKRMIDGFDEEALTDWAVCKLEDGRTLLKQIRRSATHGHFDLLSLNAATIENVRLEWATPIRGWVTRLGR